MTRTRYSSLGEGGLNWNSLPLWLFADGRPVEEIDVDYSPLQLEDS